MLSLLRTGLLLLLLPGLALAQGGEIDLDEIDGEMGRDRPPMYPEEITAADLAQRVLVVPLRGATRSSEGIGELLAAFVGDELSATDHLDVVSLPECDRVEDIDAELYYAGCPPGDELGCQFVIGEVNNIDRVVGGRVTDRGEGRYRIIITILNVRSAQEEYTYALDLGAGEDSLLPRTVELALDRLRREELLAPYRDAEEQHQELVAAMKKAQSEEERRLVARMESNVDTSSVDDLEDERRLTARDVVTEDDLAEIKENEGARREWDEMGLTERQYLSYRNSGLDWEDWSWRASGHRFQILLSAYGGLVGGATSVRYYGHYLRSPNDLSQIADTYAYQQVEEGTSFVVGGGAGFGLWDRLDIEASAWLSRADVYILLYNDRAVEDVDGSLVPDPDARRPGDWRQQDLNLWGGDVMVRFLVLTVPLIRPTIGAGLAWVVYPDLFAAASETGEDQGIPDSFHAFDRLTDFGLQLEPGVNFDFHKNMGVFLRVPITIGLNPARTSVTQRPVEPILTPFESVSDTPPFGNVKVVIGFQGRLLGLPVKKKDRSYVDDDILDDDP